MLTRLTPEMAVDKAMVASVHWDKRYGKALVITMQDGTVHRVNDKSNYGGGWDCYEIERRLLDA